MSIHFIVKWGFLLLLFFAGMISICSKLQHERWPAFEASSILSDIKLAEEKKTLYEKRTVSSGITNEVHSATVVATKSGGLRAFWYGGEREGGPDVAIFSAQYDAQQGWDNEKILVTREEIQRQQERYIKKLGNPIAVIDRQGKLWLFFVSVSLGGWAGSSINVMTSNNDGQSWSNIKRLVSSPFINISTLVKGTAFLYQDGSIGLPIYHEFIGKFSEILRINSSGLVLDKQRLTWGRNSIQPIVVVHNEAFAEVYMRSTDDRNPYILARATTNSGRSWSDVKPLSLPNPNAAIAGLSIDGDRTLLVFNNSKLQRNTLTLASSEDMGATWQVLFDFERQEPQSGERFSYPTMIQSGDGHFHILYSWNRKYIKQIEFDRRWLNQYLQ